MLCQVGPNWKLCQVGFSQRSSRVSLTWCWKSRVLQNKNNIKGCGHNRFSSK